MTTRTAVVFGGFALALTLTLTLLAPPARAGHYALADVPELMNEAVRAKVEAAGITTTKQLLEATARRKDRARLARKIGQPRKIVRGWADFTDLLRVNGVGPTMAKLFQAAGVANIAALRRESPAGMLAKLTVANAKYGIAGMLPSEGHLENWIAQARKLPIIVR